ncbi:MAG: hypothetical protein IT204_24690 [Fimbriimonadaceae bacterium]|nr:hypothetical protein [Fimbriimonadaceae bacterium]
MITRRRLGTLTAGLTLALLAFGCGGGSTPVTPGAGDDYGSGTFKRLGSATLKWVAGELGSTAIGGAAGIGMDAALEAIFGNDTERIEEGMDECNQKLDQVLDRLDAISTQLDDALDAIEESRDDIEALNQELAIKEPIDIIQSDYRNLEQLSRWASDDDDGNDPTSDDAEELADTIRSTSKHDIPLQLDRMHSGIVGGTGSGKGALKEWTDQILNGIHNGDDLYDAYQTLESYFGELLTIQTKGMLLIANAYEMDDDDSRYVGTAQSYRDEVFYPHVEEQLEKFLQLAESLVADQCRPNRGTFLMHGSSGEIYSRMDWIAAQCAEEWTAEHNGPKYQYGLHVHIWTDDNKVRPAGSGFSSDMPCEVYYGPTADHDQLAFDEAWGGATARRYATQRYVDLMLLDDDPRVAAFDWAEKVRVYTYGRNPFESKTLHILQDLVAGVDWTRDATLRYYDRDYNQVEAGTAGAQPHCTIVVDYRIQEVPLIWDVNEAETDTSATGWTVERLRPGSSAVTEHWCGLRGTPAKKSSQQTGFSMRLDCRNDWITSQSDKDVIAAFEGRIAVSRNCRQQDNPRFWQKYGWAVQVTSSSWTGYEQRINGIKKNERFKPGLKVGINTTGGSNNATTCEYELRVRKVRLYAP